MEVWKDIEGYEGLYQVSTYGRVKSLERDAVGLFGPMHLGEMILNCHEGVASESTRYFSVNLSKNKKKKVMSVHRLVAMTFIPNPENKPCVNHIDGNKHNNHVENLEWVTYKENTEHAIRTGLIKFPEKKPVEKKPKTVNRTWKPVIKYDSKLNPVERYESIKLAKESNGLPHIHVGLAKLYKGHYYCEADDPMDTKQWETVRRRIRENRTFEDILADMHGATQPYQSGNRNRNLKAAIPKTAL